MTEQLPEIARTAASIANCFTTGAASAEEVIDERVRLWAAIHGRDQSNESEFLRTRTAICVLYPMGMDVTADTLEYFIAFWERGGLSKVELSAAAENKYGILARP